MLIELRRPQGSLRNSITVVFDGKTDVWGHESSNAVRVIFSRHESADDKIKHLVAEAEHKKEIVVVTDDREVQYWVRSIGAGILRVKDFLPKLNLRDARPKTPPAYRTAKETKKNISYSLEHKITKEFEHIWLDKKQKRKA